MKRKRLLIFGAACLVALLVTIFITKKVHYVDQKPAVALGGEYFSKLKQGQLTDAFAMYTDEFRLRRGDDWQRLLLDLDTRYGTTTGFTLLDARTAPMAEIACVIVRYQITRPMLSSEEKLTVCPENSKTHMAIAGHEIVRLDTGQSTAAGITVQEKEIFSTGAVEPSVETRTPEAVRNAANEFYSRMSSDQFDAIYGASSNEFKASGSRDQILDFLKRVNQRIGGSCSAATLTKMTSMPSESGDFMHLWYERKCRNGNIRDGMSWKLLNGKVSLASYYLNSSEGSNLPVINADKQEDSAILAQAAMRSSEVFYQKISAQQFDGIFNLASAQLRAPERRKVLLDFLKQMSERTSTCGTPTLTETSYTTSTVGMSVALTYKRKCTNREINDMFTWKIVKGGALLDGYYVSGLTN
jgi:hypothetical protein